jgi:hypothetical protein
MTVERVARRRVGDARQNLVTFGLSISTQEMLESLDAEKNGHVYQIYFEGSGKPKMKKIVNRSTDVEPDQVKDTVKPNKRTIVQSASLYTTAMARASHGADLKRPPRYQLEHSDFGGAKMPLGFMTSILGGTIDATWE